MTGKGHGPRRPSEEEGSNGVESQAVVVPPQSAPLAAGDLEALADFCAAVELDDVSMDRWSRAHRSLDVELTLTVSAPEAAQGCTKRLSFSRTIKGSEAAGKKSALGAREKVSVDVEVPAGAKPGVLLVLDGLGDCHGESQGDVRITIRVVP